MPRQSCRPNIIGLDGSGTRALGNLENGIHVVDVAGTRIGASLPNEITLNGNVISSNAEGIFLDGPNAKETIIGDNGIGTKWDGVPSDPVHILGNFLSGVRIRNGSENNVGGRFLENGQAFQVPGNVIAGNNVGVRIEGDSALSNRVQRNSIFENSGSALTWDAMKSRRMMRKRWMQTSAQTCCKIFPRLIVMKDSMGGWWASW